MYPRPFFAVSAAFSYPLTRYDARDRVLGIQGTEVSGGTSAPEPVDEKGDPRSPNKWSRVSGIEYYDYIRDTIYYHQFFRPQKLYNTTRLFTRRPCSWFVPLEYRRLEATPRSATEQIQYQLFIFSQTLLSHYMTHPMSSAHAS